VLFKSLQQALKLFLKGKRSPAILVRHIRNILESEKHVDSIDYVEIRSADTFEKISCIEKSVVVLLAVRVGGVRLIDNKIID
jgi:pantoate--beta-alanine ligase